MRAWGLLLAVVVGLGGNVAEGIGAQAVFRSGVTIVTIDVSVRRRNAAVPGLAAQDFRVTDNGEPQTVELVDADGLPLDVSMLFDLGYFSSQRIGGRFHDAAMSIASLLRPTDRLRIVTFASRIRELVPMSSPAAISHLDADFWRTGQSYWDELRDPKLGAALSDAILFGLSPAPEPDRRHLVVTFSGALDSASVLQFDDSLPEVAARSDALLFIAMWNGWKSPSMPHGLSESSLLSFVHRIVADAAEATGGDVRSAEDGVTAFKAILSDFRQRYVLRYAVKGVPAKGWHAVEVRLPAFPDYSVRARSGYFAR